MRAVILNEFGGPEVMRLSEVSDPTPGPDEVLVDVAATALNRADILQRKGFYPNPFPAEHDIPGMEFSGTVAAIGSRVTTWQVGDEVMGIVAGGAYAERLVIHERQAMRIPRRAVSHQDAGRSFMLSPVVLAPQQYKFVDRSVPTSSVPVHRRKLNTSAVLAPMS